MLGFLSVLTAQLYPTSKTPGSDSLPFPEDVTHPSASFAHYLAFKRARANLRVVRKVPDTG